MIVHPPERVLTQVPDEAISFAILAHAGQRRFDGSMYFEHPIRVAKLVEANKGSAEAQTAALLHDVIEDTEVTHPELVERFGQRVADLVLILSRRRGDECEPDETYAEFISRICEDPEAAAIKRCDLIDNLSTLPFGHRLWERYLIALDVINGRLS